jgi:hypothetical protein
MYVASQLARQKYGGPPEFYALTVGLYGDESTDNGLTCNGISYNTQGSPASTCTNWSIEDVATAYRLHRGICDTVSQTRFINIFQGKAPE